MIILDTLASLSLNVNISTKHVQMENQSIFSLLLIILNYKQPVKFFS